jgi:hypothetical protein
MHNLSGGLVLGYHGCDAAVGEQLLNGASFKLSTNDWDWLGPGVYFWEANPKRGFDFAGELKERGYKHAKIETPFVIGAVISPGLCLDLTTKAGIDIVSEAYRVVRQTYELAGEDLPANSDDLLQRRLDCAVIQYVHRAREEEAQASIDTCRCVFIEGQPVYPSSGFYSKSHIQLAVRNLDCIKGIFRVPKDQYE